MTASGCVVECWICNREVACSNLSPGYFAPRSTQPSIPLGSVNEYQLRLGRQRQVWLIPIVDERVGVQIKLWNPLRTRAIPERFCSGDSLRRGTISSVCTFTLPLFHQLANHSVFRRSVLFRKLYLPVPGSLELLGVGLCNSEWSNGSGVIDAEWAEVAAKQVDAKLCKVENEVREMKNLTRGKGVFSWGTG